jgi:hypothetical protein
MCVLNLGFFLIAMETNPGERAQKTSNAESLSPSAGSVTARARKTHGRSTQHAFAKTTPRSLILHTLRVQSWNVNFKKISKNDISISFLLPCCREAFLVDFASFSWNFINVEVRTLFINILRAKKC